jgi:hypothetical protein
VKKMHHEERIELKKKLQEILESKRDEFHMLGYDGATIDEIWECVISKYKKEWPQFFQTVNDIYALKPTTFMNWLTMNAYKGIIDTGKTGLL